jgi:hypothetical protein
MIDSGMGQAPAAVQDIVTEPEIRHLVRLNWVFLLYSHRPWRLFAHYILPLLLILLGALTSALLGVLDTFIRNPLAYTGAIGLFVALSAYMWLAGTLPRVLVHLYPAFGGNSILRKQDYLQIIERRARFVNSRWLLAVVGGGIGVLFLNVLLNQWSDAGRSGPEWIGTPWVQSDQALFFAAYQGLFSVIGSAVLLGTGLIGLIGTIWLIHGIFTQPLRLEYYRRISSVSDISIGITFWTLFALIAVIFSVSISPVMAEDIVARVVLSILASGALVSIISLPILFARNAIVREKEKRIGYFEQYCHVLSTKILEAASQKPEEVESLRKSRAQLINEIEEIEKIPEWPVSTLRAIQLISVSPLIGILNFVFPLIEPRVQAFQKLFFDLFS